MIRRLFTLLSALSLLLLCIVMAVLWVRSYWVEDHVVVAASGRIVLVNSASGRLLLVRETVPRHDERATWDTRRASHDFRTGRCPECGTLLPSAR